MRTNRRNMTVRLVPLASSEASDARVGGSVDERIALVTLLSEQLWVLTGRPMPSYKRATMPVVLRTLHDPVPRD